MTIKECHDFLQFWINKSQGAFYTHSELDDLIDAGQMALYSELQPKYGTSERIKDSLSPFRDTYDFNYNDTLLGVVEVPSSQEFLDLLDLYINYDISSRSILRPVPVAMVNEDKRIDRLNSQVDPVSSTSPVGEVLALGKFQLHPKVQYRGRVTFLSRPPKPSFVYTLISGRVVNYNSSASTQLAWKASDHMDILLKALASIGINIGSRELVEWSELKTSQNANGQNQS